MWLKINSLHQVDGLVQDCSISIANVQEILQSCTKPSKLFSKLTPADPVPEGCTEPVPINEICDIVRSWRPTTSSSLRWSSRIVWWIAVWPSKIIFSWRSSMLSNWNQQRQGMTHQCCAKRVTQLPKVTHEWNGQPIVAPRVFCFVTNEFL